MNESIAVWDGRFQPPHKGHIAVAEQIVRQFGTELVIMIIQSSQGERDDYSRAVNVHHKLSRNPLTFWERHQLLARSLSPLGCGARIEILGIPRPDLYWDLARCFYPSHRFICLTGKDEYEKRKERFWAGLGETTRIVDIASLPTVSATDFKRALKAGKGWEEFIPEAALAYFKQIDGPSRFLRADL